MISVIVLTKNEENRIEKCIKCSLFFDEIVVVDDFSVDKTVKLLKKFRNRKIKIYKRKLNENFAAQRNFGMSKAHGDWIMFIDADEIVSKSLAKEILQSTKNEVFVGFYIKRRDYLLGKELLYGETGKIKLLRLAKRNSGKWRRSVHEFWDIRGETRELEHPILHYSHQELSGFIEDVNRYSTIHASELAKEGKKTSLTKIIIWPIGKFFVNYIVKLGFLDGTMGFIMAVMMSFHSFLAWSKLWQG